MFRTTIKIYLTANGLLAFFTLVSLFGEWREVINTFLSITGRSLVAGLPALIFLYLAFYACSRLKLSALMAWIAICLAMPICIFIIKLLSEYWFDSEMSMQSLFSALLTGYLSYLVQSVSIHRIFLSNQMENQNTHREHWSNGNL